MLLFWIKSKQNTMSKCINILNWNEENNNNKIDESINFNKTDYRLSIQ